MESYSKEVLRRKTINRILKCSTQYSFMDLESLDTIELFNIQSNTFRTFLLEGPKHSESSNHSDSLKTKFIVIKPSN